MADDVADKYYNSRTYDSRIGAWASKQSAVLKNRNDLILSIKEYKKKYNKIDRRYQGPNIGQVGTYYH